MKKAAVFSSVCVVLAGLFLNSDKVTAEVVKSVTLCVGTLIPSLFPFMTVSLFLSICGAGDILSFFLSPFTKHFLSLPSSLGQTVFFSFVGGYPTGARLLGSLVDDGRLTPHDAGTLLSFCVGSGPAFVVLAVGKGMFGSAKTGIILLSSQLIANLVIGSVICRKNPVAVSFCGNNDKPLYSSFVRAVAQASSGVMTICSYVVLISALCASLDFNGKVNALFSVAEVTAGCLYASKQSGVSALCLASFLLAFSGISVCCQISAIAMQYSIPVSPFIKGRLICGVLSSVMTFILTRLFPQSVKAAYILSEPIAASSPNRILCAVCLCIMATITFSDFNEKVDF